VPFERALPGTKDVFPFSPNDPADELPAVSETPHDPFDRHIVLRQFENRGVDLFAPLIAFILKALGGSKQLGIDRRRTDGGSNLAHCFAYGIEKGATGILHQVPTISDLRRMRKRPGSSFGPGRGQQRQSLDAVQARP
jgi:hypothetical protein